MTPLNIGGLGDLAGVTEVGVLDLGAGSRRGSFSRPGGSAAGRVGSESKERQRDNSSGIPKP